MQYFDSEDEYLDTESDYYSIPETIPETVIDEQNSEELIINKKYCIAFILVHAEINTYQQPLFLNKITTTTFYKYPAYKLKQYYMTNTMYAYFCPTISIVQIQHIFHDPFEPEYQVIDKTFWLKLIQRTWKRKYAEKQKRMKQRGSLQNQRNFELYGKYTRGFNRITLLPIF